MWVGGIRLVVQTKNQRHAGTDSLVQASVRRNGSELALLNLDYPDEDDLERGAIRAYDYVGPTKLARRNDRTPQLPDGIGQIPSPYPGYGLEFSDGLSGHLSIRLRIRGNDLWIKDNVDLYVQNIREVATSFDTLAWQLDTFWTYVASWSVDKRLSTDSSEGDTTLTLLLG